MKNLIDLTGRMVIVVGASSGIGKQTAITLSELGAKVILIARRENLLKEVLSSLDGEGHAYYTFDLHELESIGVLTERIVAEHGGADGLVYAAGISKTLPLKMLSPERIHTFFEINYFAFIEVIRQLCKKGRYHEGLRIVGISSATSLQGSKAKELYASTKAAMDAAVRCLASELAEKQICINTVAPSIIATEMFEGYAESVGDAASEEAIKRQYLGVGEPEDVANAIAFLISPAARFITGITLPVDGGYTTS